MIPVLIPIRSKAGAVLITVAKADDADGVALTYAELEQVAQQVWIDARADLLGKKHLLDFKSYWQSRKKKTSPYCPGCNLEQVAEGQYCPECHKRLEKGE